MAGFGNWQTQLLGRMGLPATPNNLKFLTAWQAHEGGSAAFNPLNTTQSMPGASAYNSVGVRNFTSPEQGLAATVRTLRNGYYPGILAALKSGNPTWNPLLGKNLSTWGTGSSWMGGYRGTDVPPAASVGSHVAASVVPPPKVTPPGFKTIQKTARVFDPLALGQGILSGLATGQTPDIGSLASSAYKNISVPVRIPVGGKMISRNQIHTEGAPVPATKYGSATVQLAAKQLGQPYVWGAESRKEGGFDCSGLVDWAMRQEGYKGPRLTTGSIARMGVSVKNKPLQPGDLVLSNGGEHVSIYAGNGKCIVAPHTGAVVRWQPLSDFHITDVRRV